MDDVQCASPKKVALSTACNRLPPKSKGCRRLTIGFPQKVRAVDGLQLASLEKFLLLTACNELPSKSKGCRRLTIGFPQKVFAVDGLQFASLKKQGLSTACNGLSPKSKHGRRLATAFRNGGEMGCPPSPRLAKGHLAGASTTVWQVARAAFGRWRTMRCAALFMTHAQTRSIHAEAEARVGWAPSRARS